MKRLKAMLLVLAVGVFPVLLLTPVLAPQAAFGKDKLSRKQKISKSRSRSEEPVIPEVESPGPPPGEAQSKVRVASLVYDKSKGSVCFSDHFLRAAADKTTVSTSRRLHPKHLASPDIFKYPMVVMTGEGNFKLREEERKNLAEYLRRGGFLLASAGCSSKDWDRSFRREIAKLLPDQELEALSMDHPVFHTAKDIASIRVKKGTPQPLEGMQLDGRLAVLYSSDGLNDTEHVSGCCCCTGNEILNAEDINVNVLLYSLTH